MALDPRASLDEATRSAVDAAFETLYEQHPEWGERWGEHGRFHTRQDLAFHASFLQTAQELGEDPLYESYILWCAGVLEARDVEHEILVETLVVFADCMEAIGVDVAVVRRSAERLRKEGVPAPAAPDPVAGRLADALMAADIAASQVMISETTAPEQALMTAMVIIGDRWASNQISVADEHLATATCQVLLAERRTRLGSADAKPTYVLACVEGNHHDLGLRALSNICEGQGIKTHLLGADVPNDSLIQFCKENDVDHLVLSAALPQHVPVARKQIALIREAGIAPPAKIFLGGHAFADTPGLWRLMGADGGGPDVAPLLRAAE